MAPICSGADSEARERLDLSNRISQLIVPEGGISFKADAFNRLCGPVVYMFIKRGIAEYVGMSKRGICRPGSHTHHRSDWRMDADEVMIWPCLTEAAAMELEALLIGALMPLGNKRRTRAYLAALLGGSQAVALKTKSQGYVRSVDASTP